MIIVAHHYLFILKEILGTQTNTHYQLVSQVFWGLLACEIQLQKSRESTELTTVRKIKDMVRTRFAESPMGMLHQTSWLLHWSLVFSFTAEHTNGMFAALLADRMNFGDNFLNVIELRSQHLMRHMVGAFLLGRSNYQPRPQANKSRVQLTLL
jgi:translation initiation factor 3 subunit E